MNEIKKNVNDINYKLCKQEKYKDAKSSQSDNATICDFMLFRLSLSEHSMGVKYCMRYINMKVIFKKSKKLVAVQPKIDKVIAIQYFYSTKNVVSMLLVFCRILLLLSTQKEQYFQTDFRFIFHDIFFFLAFTFTKNNYISLSSSKIIFIEYLQLNFNYTLHE